MNTSSQVDDKEAEDRWRAMVGNDRSDDSWIDKFHWHVYDPRLVEELYSCLGYEVKAMDLIAPYHMMSVARKPHR